MTIQAHEAKNNVICELKNWWSENNDYWTGLYCDHGFGDEPEMYPRSFCKKCGEFGGNATHGLNFCECGTGFTRYQYMMFSPIQSHHISTQIMYYLHEQYELLYEELLRKSHEWRKKRDMKMITQKVISSRTKLAIEWFV